MYIVAKNAASCSGTGGQRGRVRAVNGTVRIARHNATEHIPARAVHDHDGVRAIAQHLLRPKEGLRQRAVRRKAERAQHAQRLSKRMQLASKNGEGCRRRSEAQRFQRERRRVRVAHNEDALDAALQQQALAYGGQVRRHGAVALRRADGDGGVSGRVSRSVAGWQS